MNVKLIQKILYKIPVQFSRLAKEIKAPEEQNYSKNKCTLWCIHIRGLFCDNLHALWRWSFFCHWIFMPQIEESHSSWRFSLHPLIQSTLEIGRLNVDRLNFRFGSCILDLRNKNYYLIKLITPNCDITFSKLHQLMRYWGKLI